MNNHSLLARIVITTSATLIITAIIAGVLAFLSSHHQSHELFDEYLENMAIALSEMDLKPQSYYQVSDESGLWIDVFATPNHELNTIPTGFSSRTIDGEPFYIYHLKENGKSVIIRQPLDGQNELATLSALHSLLPMLVVSVLLMLVLPLMIWWCFRPVKQATKAISHRQPHDLSPLDLDNFPKEILPFAIAMNGLLDKAKHDIDTQKRFIADASHELRSPLTAISLQVQRLHSQTELDKIKSGLAKLTDTIAKNQTFIDELLTLARLNASTMSDTPTSMADTIRSAVGFLLPIIHDKHITIDTDVGADFGVFIAPTPLLQLIKNLLQNATLYTPTGGNISVSLGQKLPAGATLVIGQGKNTKSKQILQIHDSGQGIAPTDYQKVFEPFVRLSDSDRSDTSDSKGTGLGLAMVKAVCEQAHVDVYFGKSVLGGLAVGLVF